MTTVASVMLLFNQNLPPSLPRRLADLYPGSVHVKDIDLAVGGDNPVWDYAKDRSLIVATKDTDYRDLSHRLGYPPKVVLIRLGNCSRDAVVSLLRERYADILSLQRDERRGCWNCPERTRVHPSTEFRMSG